MKRFSKLILSLSILFFSFIHVSCDVLWFQNFKESVGNDISATITFYMTKDEMLSSGEENKSKSEKYILGKELQKSDLPSYKDSTVSSWKPEARLSDWHFYRSSESKEDLTSKGIFESWIPDSNIDLYALWHYGYYVDVLVEDVNGNMVEEVSKELRWGPEGQSVSLEPEARDGFTVSSNSIVISSAERKLISVKYVRKTTILTFDAGEGVFEDGNATASVIGKFGQDFVPPVPVKDGYRFAGWDKSLPEKIPGEDMLFTAKWIDSEFDLTYADWGCGRGTEKPFSGIINSLPSYYELEAETEIPVPQSTAAASDNILFDGYYYDVYCSNPLSKNASGNYYLKASDTGDRTIYAKWKYKTVYVDPENGLDSNTGNAIDKPVKTVFEAKHYLANGQEDSSLVLLKTITSGKDFVSLQNISTEEYKNAVVKADYDKLGNNPVLLVNDFALLNNVIIETDLMTEAIVIDAGNLVVENAIIRNKGSYADMKLVGSGRLILEGPLTIESSSGTTSVLVDASATGTLEFNAKGRLISSKPVTLGDGKRIKLNAALAGTDSVAVIKVSAPDTYPVVLEDDVSGNYVRASYNRFESGHLGYTINNQGKLVEASGIDINPGIPVITEYEAGNLETTNVAFVNGGDTFVKFIVDSSAYDKIELWGTDRYIQYTIEGDYGNVPIVNEGGVYVANINLTTLQSGTDVSTRKSHDLKQGISSLVIYAAAAEPLQDVISTKEYKIFVTK